MKVKNTFKKAIAAVEVVAMILALVGGLSIANTTDVLAAGGTLVLNEGIEIVSDSEEVLTFTAPADGTYYFYSVTTGNCDPYADLITETEEYYSDDERYPDFLIAAELSKDEACELIVSSYGAEEGMEYETTVYVCDEAIAKGMAYQINGGGSKYITVGDGYELTIGVENLAGEVMTTIPEEYSIKWTKEDENGIVAELDETSMTYSIDVTTAQDLCAESTNYICYSAKMYKGEEEIDEVYFYLYDSEKSVSIMGHSEYAGVGDKVTLELSAYDYNEDDIDLKEKTNYTYKWYKATENEDGDLDNYKEITGATGYSYVAEVAATDFCEEANEYICFVCELYIDGEYIDYASFNIYDKNKYIEIYGDIYYVNEGDSVTLQPAVYDYDGNKIDINDENLEFKWYEYNSLHGGVVIAKTPTLTIDNVSFEDNSLYYFVKVTYKDNASDYAYFYVYDAYTSYFGSYDEIPAEVGQSITLEAEVIDYNDNMLTDYDDTFTFEWHKVTYDVETDEENYSEVIGTGLTYKIEAVEESDLYNEDADYVRYVCAVYREGNSITEYTAALVDAVTYWDVKIPETIYASVGDTVTFKPTIVDAYGQEIDIDDERFTYEWFDLDYEIVSHDSTYTINAVKKKDFCNEEYYEYYEVYIYDSVTNRSDWVSFYLYNEDSGEPTTQEPTTDAPTTETPTTAVTEPTTAAPTTEASEKVTAPAKAKIKKITPKKKAAKKIKISLKKIKAAKGYQIAIYKTKKNAKKDKKAIVKKIVKKTKVTIKSKKLKNKKNLFVKVRAYALDGKTKVYGKWSKIKQVKIKRATV